jgi:hypothetical protein
VAKRKRDRPCIEYLPLGPYPGYVGFTTSPRAFQRELRRLKIRESVSFVNAGAGATTHFLERDGQTTTIIAIPPPSKDRPFEQYAGLVAHEAMHAVQEIWRGMGEKEPGDECEAYLLQMIVQSCLQVAYKTGRERRLAP